MGGGRELETLLEEEMEANQGRHSTVKLMGVEPFPFVTRYWANGILSLNFFLR